MPLLSPTRKIRTRRNIALNFIRATTILFTFQIWFVLSGTDLKLDKNSNEAALLKELSGTHLLVSASPDPPWLNERMDANGSSIYYGLHVNICNYLAQALNATYSFVRATKDEERAIGRRDASYNLLLRGDVNISTKFVLLVRIECILRADCSIPLLVTHNQLMVPWPKEENRILAAVRPFQFEVWLLLAISILCVTFTIAYIPKFYKESNNKREDFGISTIYVLTGEGDWHQWKYKLSFRILQGTWCLAAFVLLNAYSSTIISYLTAPKLMPVARNLDEVASGMHQNLKLLLEKDGIMKGRYLEATNGTWKLLGDSIRRHPDSLFSSNGEAIQKLLTGQYAYTSVNTRVMGFMDNLYKEAGNRCRFTFFNKDNSETVNLVWSFPKDWRYTKIVNNRLKCLAEFGLVDYWTNKILPKLDQCQLDNFEKASAEKRILTLKDLMGPFSFLLAGAATSFLVFLIEKIVFIYHRHICISHNGHLCVFFFNF